MIYPIVSYGVPILHQEAEPIPSGTPVKELIADMFETLAGAHGLGLAAPQIGKSCQLFIADMGFFAPEEEANHPQYKKVYINPVLILPEPVEWIEGEEGCLSIPTIYGKVRRSNQVQIEFFDENWQRQLETLYDMPARVIQHEYDHLQGKLYIDYLPASERSLIEPLLKKIASGNMKARYPMRFR